MAKTRFITGTIKAAATETTQMPWARGKRRAAFVAKRKAQVELRKSA